MGEKDVVKAVQMLHVIQSKKNAIKFAEYISKHEIDFNIIPSKKQEKIYLEYLNQTT
jgi:hypothetical protein